MQERINILDELKAAGAILLLNADNRNYFSIPDKYFDDLADNIRTEIFIKSLPTVNPYTVPERYFESLAENVIEKIFLTENVITSGVPLKEVYAVPDGYFDGFATNVLARIKASEENAVQKELEEISPFLNTIPRTNVYSVPENYFNHLVPSISTNDNSAGSPAKVVSIGRAPRKWFSYAVAACVAAVIFAGGYLYFGKADKVVVDNTYAAMQNMDIQKEISGLSDNEIRNYLKDNNKMAVYTNAVSDDELQPMDIQNMLENISDDEIQQYLKDNPESVEAGEGI